MKDDELPDEEANRLPTVPPPPGARDPYSAPTKVAETTENVLEAMKIAAERGTPMKPLSLPPPSSRPPSSSRPAVREVDLRRVSDDALKAEIRRLRHDEADAEVGTVLLPVTSNEPAPRSSPSNVSSVFVPEEGEPRRAVKTIPPARRAAPEQSSVGFWILVGGIAVAVATVGVIVGLYFFLS